MVATALRHTIPIPKTAGKAVLRLHSAYSNINETSNATEIKFFFKAPPPKRYTELSY